MYGVSHIPHMYLFSNYFKVASTGFAALAAWNIMKSQVTLLPIKILQFPQLNLTNVSDLLELIFMIIFPNFALGYV